MIMMMMTIAWGWISGDADDGDDDHVDSLEQVELDQ